MMSREQRLDFLEKEFNDLHQQYSKVIQRLDMCWLMRYPYNLQQKFVARKLSFFAALHLPFYCAKKF